MKNTHTLFLAVCLAVLIVPSSGRAGTRAPERAADQPSAVNRAEPSDSSLLPELPASVAERFRELEEKDPAAFRDLLRRSLSARLIRTERGEKFPADLPVELAGGMTDEGR